MNPDQETALLVLSGDVHATAWGEVTWTCLNGSWRGRVEWCSASLDGITLMLEFQVRPRRPMQPSVLLLANGICLLRIDHNQTHKGAFGTHVQSGVDTGLLRWPSPDEAGSPPQEGEVSLQDVKIACLKGASILGVNVEGVEWIDPPEGV